MAIERRTYDFTVESKSDDGGEFEGYAACFHNLDSYNDIIAPGAFKDDLKSFLAEGIVAWQHDWMTPIGKPLSAKEDAKGLYCKAMISDTAAGRDARTLMKDGVVKKLSIGFRCTGREMLADGDAVKAYWKDAGYTATADEKARSQYGARLITKARLFEFSPVSVPANTLCDVTQVKGEPPGRSLDDRSDTTLEVVTEYLADIEAYLAMCRKDGRPATFRRQVQFQSVYDRLGELLVKLSDAPDAEGRSTGLPNGHAQYAHYLATEARRLGVAV